MIRYFTFLCLALAGTGCVSYSAQVNRSVRRGDVELLLENIEGARSGAAMALSVIDTPPDLVLRGAWVGDEGTLCSGRGATAMGRSSGLGVDAPLEVRERISLAFGSVYAFADEVPQLHLLVEASDGRQHCLSFPMASRDERLKLQPQQRWTLGVDMSLEGFTSQLGAIRQFFTIPVSLGLWLDRVHVRASVGIGGAGCPDSHCFVSEPNSRIDYTTSVPFAVGADYFLVEAGEFGLGASVRYRAMRLAADTYDGRQAFWMHGPVLAPFIGAILPKHRRTSELGGARAGFITLEMPVGLAITPEGESLSLGVNLALHVTAF